MSKYVSCDEMMEILDNKYLLPFRKDERLRGLSGIDVVRCKDCKWWGRKTTYKDGTIITDCKRGLMANENGFCSFGERKE